MSEQFDKQLKEMSDRKKRDICIMANAISKSIFDRDFIYLSIEEQQKCTLAVVNIFKELIKVKENKNV